MKLLMYDPRGPVEFIRKTSIKPWGWHVYLKVGGDIWINQLQNLKARGIVPVVTLEPRMGLDSIIRNDYDWWLRKLYSILETDFLEYYIRFAHEFNGDWYPWGRQPEKYRQAYLHVFELMDCLAEANDIWCPNRIYNEPFGLSEYVPNPSPLILGLDAYAINPDGSVRNSYETYFDTIDYFKSYLMENKIILPYHLWLCETGVPFSESQHHYLDQLLDDLEHQGFSVFGYFNANKPTASGDYELTFESIQLFKDWF